MAGVLPQEGSDMRNVLRLLQGGVLITFALGVVVLAGCSATASETDLRDSSSALTASPTPNGGVLACSATHSDGVNKAYSVILLSNDDDAGSIRIDRLLVYGYGGNVVCNIPDPIPNVLNPHQLGALPTKPMAQAGCIPSEGSPKFRFIVYWSRDGNKGGTLNPLDGWSEITYTDSTGAVLSKMARDCKAITLPPDKCAEKKCRTENICGQAAPCEICVEGKCVVNTPHFDAACRPSCGEASALCDVAGACGATKGQCVPTSTWDCPSCCTQY
jgi:hypothetical protein